MTPLCAEVDPEIFFPERGESPRPAKEVCARCEVRAWCLDRALAIGPVQGVWGGTTERERKLLIRQPRAA